MPLAVTRLRMVPVHSIVLPKHDGIAARSPRHRRLSPAKRATVHSSALISLTTFAPIVVMDDRAATRMLKAPWYTGVCSICCSSSDESAKLLSSMSDRSRRCPRVPAVFGTRSATQNPCSGSKSSLSNFLVGHSSGGSEENDSAVTCARIALWLPCRRGSAVDRVVTRRPPRRSCGSVDVDGGPSISPAVPSRVCLAGVDGAERLAQSSFDSPRSAASSGAVRSDACTSSTASLCPLSSRARATHAQNCRHSHALIASPLRTAPTTAGIARSSVKAAEWQAIITTLAAIYSVSDFRVQTQNAYARGNTSMVRTKTSVMKSTRRSSAP
mmetsp:Transcript_9355/g.38361  ORF Transcript_9355/g.38361 Transcript_9355/m.38361 type:complete len:327 (+) Transcript_9355:2385-3365(+)